MYVIWHNPRCTKSRQTLALLEEKGIQPKVREYLNDSPSRSELENVCRLLKKKPIEITRTKEAEFKELGLQKDDSDEKILDALAKTPKLIERPIVIKNNSAAVIGRPPENVMGILN